MKKKPKKLEAATYITKANYEIGDKVVVKAWDDGLPVETVESTGNIQLETTIVGLSLSKDKYNTTKYIVAIQPEEGWYPDDNPFSHSIIDPSYQGRCWGVPETTILGLVPEKKKKETTDMSKDKLSDSGVLDTLKSDAGDAGYRIAAKQISKAARTGLLTLMKDKGAKRHWIKAVSEMMETEAGLATISFGLGWALKYVPGLKDDPRATHLAKEFRVEGMAMGGNLVMDEFQQYLLPLLSQIQNLPEPPKVRVAADGNKKRVEDADAEAEEEAQEEQVSPPKKSKAA